MKKKMSFLGLTLALLLTFTLGVYSVNSTKAYAAAPQSENK